MALFNATRLSFVGARIVGGRRQRIKTISANQQ